MNQDTSEFTEPFDVTRYQAGEPALTPMGLITVCIGIYQDNNGTYLQSSLGNDFRVSKDLAMRGVSTAVKWKMKPVNSALKAFVAALEGKTSTMSMPPVRRMRLKK